MSVTNRLLKLDPELKLHGEGEWDKDVFTRPGYTSFNDAGLEAETGELIYGFVRALQPMNVLETGTHVGIGASYIGMGLKDNLKGHLDTIEFIPELHERAKSFLSRVSLLSYISCHLADATKWEVPPNISYDMVLLDTEPQTRFAEFIKYYPYVKAGGFIFIHDLHRHMQQVETENGFAWPFGKIPQEIIDLENKGFIKVFHFETPRGLTGFYKVNPGDYNFK